MTLLHLYHLHHDPFSLDECPSRMLCFRISCLRSRRDVKDTGGCTFHVIFRVVKTSYYTPKSTASRSGEIMNTGQAATGYQVTCTLLRCVAFDIARQSLRYPPSLSHLSKPPALSVSWQRDTIPFYVLLPLGNRDSRHPR